MVTDRVPASQPLSSPCRRIGVGIDTSRYGHYAAFLREDLQPAAAELPFTRLRMKDIDLDRGQLTVRQGKGDKDRFVMLPVATRDRNQDATRLGKIPAGAT